MNIIEAWNKAKIGEKIVLDNNVLVKSSDSIVLPKFLWSGVGGRKNTTEENILSNNWEIKSKNGYKKKFTWREVKTMCKNGHYFPNNAKITIKWEDDPY